MSNTAADTDALIKSWRASKKRVEQIAAELAAKIDAGQLHRWAEFPPRACRNAPLQASRIC
jgi:hypothetical protein